MAVSINKPGCLCLGFWKVDMSQYNGYGNNGGGGYGQSNPYGSNSSYDTPPTYSMIRSIQSPKPA
jgi:hypothetical protein